MQASGGRLGLNEMCFTAMARLAAARGDADRAFALAQVGGGVQGWGGGHGVGRLL